MQKSAIRCAYLDLKGLHECLTKGLTVHEHIEVDTIEITLAEIEAAFSEIISSAVETDNEGS
jgi:hypothetical protein